ncbi:MAG: folate family ECF transporter S component [Clostridiales bacterium]|nr:folate family ECF transporter S component [Clostridiales bacterium]
MFRLKELFVSSWKELSNLRCITLLAMLGAISMVLGYFTIMPVPSVKITFTFLPGGIVYYLFGPVVGAIFAGAMDILNYIVRPTGPFFFGFTLSAVLTGLIYGSFLYKRPYSVKRILITNLIHMVLIDLLLNTFWLSLLYGDAFLVLLPMRLLKEIIMLPVETILLYIILKRVETTKIIKGYKSSNM